MGSAGTVCTLDSSSLPAQFSYQLKQTKRLSVMSTFGGVHRSIAATLLDKQISFTCPFCTLAEKNTIEGKFASTSSMTFTGIHSDSSTVYFDELEPPTEENGYWTLAGMLRVSV
jgi:hypothetical protein